MWFYVIAVSSLLWIATVQATPTGNHTCTGVVKHSVTVRVNVTEPVTYRTYTWCLRVPPRCSKYTVQLKDRVKIHTEMHNRTITVCCKGYVEMDYKCVPACPPQTECPNMHCNRTNHCYCTPGYQGLYCNYPCDRGFWGVDCKKPCDCPDGYICHHLTGDCMIDDRPPISTKTRRTTTTTIATSSPETIITEKTRTTVEHSTESPTSSRTTFGTSVFQNSVPISTSEHIIIPEITTSKLTVFSTAPMPTITDETTTRIIPTIERDTTPQTEYKFPTMVMSSFNISTTQRIPERKSTVLDTKYIATKELPVSEMPVVTSPASIKEENKTKSLTDLLKLQPNFDPEGLNNIVITTGNTAPSTNEVHSFPSNKTEVTAEFISSTMSTLPRTSSAKSATITEAEVRPEPTTDSILITMNAFPKTTAKFYLHETLVSTAPLPSALTIAVEPITATTYVNSTSSVTEPISSRASSDTSTSSTLIISDSSITSILPKYFTKESFSMSHITPYNGKNISEPDISSKLFPHKTNSSFNEDNLNLNQHLNSSTPKISVDQLTTQISTASINYQISVSDLPLKIDDTPYPKTSSVANLSPSVKENNDFEVSILPHLANSEIFKTTTVNTSTAHPIENLTNKRDSETVNASYESTTELLKIKEMDWGKLEGTNNISEVFPHTFNENETKDITHLETAPITTSSESEILSVTDPTRISEILSTSSFDSEKLLVETEISLKKGPTTTIKTTLPDSFHEKKYKTINNDNDFRVDPVDEGSYNESHKMPFIKKNYNNTNFIPNINEVSTKIDSGIEESVSDVRLKSKPEVTTTALMIREETSSKNVWITAHSKPAHTWYSHVKEYQRKAKNKEELKKMKTTSHFEMQAVTNKYDMSEESNVIDSMLTTFAERGGRGNNGAAPFANEEANIPSSYQRYGQLNNLSSALAEEVQADRRENSLFTLYSTSTIISCIALILLITTSTALWFCLRRKKEPTTLRGPCIMAYGTPSEFTLNPLMYDTVYPLESIEGERCIDPDIFFCPTFTNNYAEKINRELSELNYDHPRSSFCEPLYAEIHY